MNIESLPSITLSNGNVSRWMAAFNPIIFIFSDHDTGLHQNIRFIVSIQSGSTVVAATFHADSAGVAKINLFAFLKTLVKPIDDFNYSDIAYYDTNLFAPFTVNASGQWEITRIDIDGSTTITQTEIPTTIPGPYFVTYAAMQLGERYGGNLAEYVTYLNGSSAKFLTDFEEPVVWSRLPYSISFIVGDTLSTKNLIARYTAVDVNGNIVPGGLSLSYLLTELGGKLLNETGGGIVLEGSVTENSTIVKGTGIVRLRVPEVMSLVSRIKLEVYYLEGAQEIKVTRDIFIRTQQTCDYDPYVYLKWINHLGTWDYFRFGYNQYIDGNVTNDTIISKVMTDWENSEALSEVVRKSGRDAITLGAHNLKPSELKALSWLRKSIKVQMLISKAPVKWQTVVVEPGSINTRQTRLHSGSVKFKILLPEANIQTI